MERRVCPVLQAGDYYANFTAAEVIGMAGTRVKIGIIRKLA